MIPGPHPSASDLLAYLRRVDKARKLVAEFAEWLATAPPLPNDAAEPEKPTEKPQVEWQSTEELAELIVAVLQESGQQLRARDILGILQENGISFVSENPVFSVAGALKVALKNDWITKKGKGWWQRKPPAPVNLGGLADIGDLDTRGTLSVSAPLSESSE